MVGVATGLDHLHLAHTEGIAEGIEEAVFFGDVERLAPGPRAQADRSHTPQDLGVQGDLVPIQHREHRVEMHVGPVLGHHHCDHTLGSPLVEQGTSDLLDHAGLGSLAEPDEHGPVPDRLHISAFQRGAAEVGGLELAVIPEVGVPVLEVGVREHRMISIDGGDVVGLETARRPEHRVDRHPPVDPAGGVTSEQGVGEGRQDECTGVVEGGGTQGPSTGVLETHPRLLHGQAPDEVLGQLVRLHLVEQGPDLVHE